MARTARQFSIRSFREGDERALARLFNEYVAGFFGPAHLTPAAWRSQFERQSWTGPSVNADRECVRVATRGDEIVGCAVTDYQPVATAKGAIIQELCAIADEDAADIVDALVADAEERALSRGKTFIRIDISQEDGHVGQVCEGRGYHRRSTAPDVFMAAVTDLEGFLGDIADELNLRLQESEFRAWRGTIGLACGEQSCRLTAREGGLTIGGDGDADISVSVQAEALPLLLFARASVGELYVQDALGVEATDRERALGLLEALFPRVPIYLPRAQWW